MYAVLKHNALPLANIGEYGCFFIDEEALTPFDRPSRTMLTSEFSKNRSTHIVEDLNTKKLRKLTPIDCERLNGFSDNWTATMPDRLRN